MSQQLVLAIRQAICSAACRMGGESKSELRGDREIGLGHQVSVTPRWKGVQQGPSLPFPTSSLTKEDVLQRPWESAAFTEGACSPLFSSLSQGHLTLQCSLSAQVLASFSPGILLTMSNKWTSSSSS